MRLSGRTAIVTGGAAGIGAVYARALLDAGAHVVIADLQAAEGEALARALSAAQGARALFIQTDVTHEADTTQMAHAAVESFGTIDILVNNAAIYMALGKKQPFDEISAEEWDRVMAVNVKGVWQCAKAVTPFMRERHYGKIINIASVVADTGAVGFAHYVASKAAVVGLTRALARELGPDNICVNAVSPGLVSNEASRQPNPRGYLSDAAKTRALQREMYPEDLVGAVMFLASSESDFITGQNYIVDGGGVMH
jgi:NAD(P)-dependent dehydrogenase (short-subunit alcohol dehydrogenase family)